MHTQRPPFHTNFISLISLIISLKTLNNKGELSMDNRFLRNKDLIPQKLLDKISIIGLGGIGSFLVQGLAMMGWKEVHGYDSDIVEDHNLSTTCYPLNSNRIYKVVAGESLFNSYSDERQKFISYKQYGKMDKPTSKMVVCTDNMESRKMVYNDWKSLNEGFFIDLRMGATSIELVTVTPNNDNYMDTWVPTHTIPEAPCSQKHTVFATMHIVSLGLSQLYNLIANLAYYDYIWTSLSPNIVEFGTLITPNMNKEVSYDTGTRSINQLEGNAIRSNISYNRST